MYKIITDNDIHWKLRNKENKVGWYNLRKWLTEETSKDFVAGESSLRRSH